MKTIADAEPGCSYLQVNFAIRVKARQLEKDGLREAPKHAGAGAHASGRSWGAAGQGVPAPQTAVAPLRD